MVTYRQYGMFLCLGNGCSCVSASLRNNSNQHRKINEQPVIFVFVCRRSWIGSQFTEEVFGFSYFTLKDTISCLAKNMVITFTKCQEESETSITVHKETN